MADIAFVNASSDNTGLGEATPAVPTGTQNGDLLLCICGSGYNMGGPADTIGTPAGWEFGATQELVVSTIYYRASWFWKIAASESGSYSFGVAGKNNGAIVSAYRNVSPTSPIHQQSDVAYITNDSIVRCAGFTTTLNGCMLVALPALGAASPPAFTPPTGMTERGDEGYAGTTVVSLADVLQATAGPTGDKDATIGGFATTGKHGFLVALAPIVPKPVILKSGNRIW